MNMMLRLLAVTVVMATVAYAITLPECSREVCNCPVPNEFPGDLKAPNSGNSSCICTCGRKLTTACDFDGHCGKGTYCGAPKDITIVADRSKGVCSDKCKKKKCPVFNKCVINDAGDAECHCQKFDCETGGGKSPAYKAEQDGQIMTFENMCHTVNINCQLSKNNPDAKQWQFVPDHPHDFSYFNH